jgi:hypothetical protein
LVQILLYLQQAVYVCPSVRQDVCIKEAHITFIIFMPAARRRARMAAQVYSCWRKSSCSALV